METKKQLSIIIAEDDDGHAELVKDALEESGNLNAIIRFPDGMQTWKFLEKEAVSDMENQNKTYLLLLDINMPGMNGVEVLKRVKEHPQLKSIPVVMLTTTDDPDEIELCYKLGCNIYITKPIDFAKFSEKLRRLGLFIQVIKM
jgi:CheY-like chemotaxis protein